MSRRGRSAILEVPGVQAGDPRLLGAGETLFLVLRGRSAAATLLFPPEEVFGRNEVRFGFLSLRPTDYLGQACLHCGDRVEGLEDFMFCIRSGQVVAAFHETCFKRWFVLQDKGAFGTYRFGFLQDCVARSVDGVTRLSLSGQGQASEELPFDRIEVLEYVHLAEPGLHSEAAYVRKGGETESGETSAPGTSNPSDTNILFCPHCDHPNKVAFLETAGVHLCQRCGGKYGVKIVAL